MRGVAVLACLAVLVGVLAGVGSSATTRIPRLYSSCKILNGKYRHGLGKFGAHDSTSGDPVTNFFRSNRLYTVAIHYNRGLDRDHDGIACEKH